MSRRISFDVDDDVFAALEQIRQECGFEDWKSYFNSELTLLKYAFRAIKNGKAIVIYDDANNKVQEIEMKWMQHIRPAVPLRLV